MRAGTARKTISVLFYGVGGQGVLAAAEVCALAAMGDGYRVKKSEVKGMAQRGGSVESYVRFGSAPQSPLPLDGDVDLLVCLHPEEHDRLKGQLKPGGTDLFPYLEKARAAVAGHGLFLNTYMLGVLSSFLPIREECWREALIRKFKKNAAGNTEVFLKGRAEGPAK